MIPTSRQHSKSNNFKVNVNSILFYIYLVNSEMIKSLSTRFKNERSTLNSNNKTILIFVATIKYPDYKKIVDDEFKSSKPADTLCTYMFESKQSKDVN